MSDSESNRGKDDGSGEAPSAAERPDQAPSSAGRYPADEVTVREGRRRKRGSTEAEDRPRKSSRPRKRGRRPGRRGRGSPAFLAGFPDDPELSPVVAAFERGEYATVRERAAHLAKHAESKRVRQAARELLYRIEPDPMAKLLLGAAFALLLFLVIWAYAAH